MAERTVLEVYDDESTEIEGGIKRFDIAPGTPLLVFELDSHTRTLEIEQQLGAISAQMRETYGDIPYVFLALPPSVNFRVVRVKDDVAATQHSGDAR